MKTAQLTSFQKPRAVFAVGVVLIAILLSIVAVRLVQASNETITAGTSATTEIKTASPISGITINGTGDDTIPVKLRVTSGSLAMSTTAGLTFTGSPTGSTLYFSGTRSNINAALATLTYTRNVLGTDTLEISLVGSGEVFFSETGHLYEYVSSTLNWTNAKAAAEGRSKYGATGYLATITSQAENDFVAARLSNAGWMGASDVSSESVWKWVTGPENGTTFSNGNSPNMSAASGQYQNWNSGEPNDSGGEDCGQFLSGGSGKWNDLNCTGTTLPGYVVEYGAPGNMPSVAAANIALTTIDTGLPTTPGTPSTITPTTDQTPTWSWTSSSDAGSGLASPAYSVQWSQSSNFDSGVTSATSSSASYTHSSNLASGTWYFRVRASDAGGNNSAYSPAGAVVVDVTGPTTPGLSATMTKTQDNTPTIDWDASSDSGSGLANPTYTVQRSQNSSFGSGITSTTTNTLYHTATTLADGTWYFRVRASDQLGNTSAWSSTATIVVDTAGPTTPGTPSTTTPTNTKKPTWNWTASSDTGTGLDNPAYSVAWSLSSTFSSGVTNDTINSTSYVHTSNLADGTWYFRVRASDNVANTSGWSLTGSVTIDSALPMVANQQATSNSTTSQTITWNTDKLSSSRIYYGPTTAYDSSTAEQDTSPRVTSHTMMLSGLKPCVLYHYQIVSLDVLGNQTASNDSTFITTGCAGQATVERYAESNISNTTGGSVSLNTTSGTVVITAPANFGTTDAAFQIKQTDTAATLAAISSPSGLVAIGKTFDLKAMEDTTTSVSSFINPVTITLPYTANEIARIIEKSLAIYRWNNATDGWQKLSNCQVDTSVKTVMCNTPGFSTFAIFGESRPVPSVPAVTSGKTTHAFRGNTFAAAITGTETQTTTESKTPLRQLFNNPRAAAGTPKENTSGYSLKWITMAVTMIGLFWFIVYRRRQKDQSEHDRELTRP